MKIDGQSHSPLAIKNINAIKIHMCTNIATFSISLILSFLIGIFSVGAKEPKSLGTFPIGCNPTSDQKKKQCWEAARELENGKRVCYAGIEPQKSEGKYTKRGPIFLLVTHRPAENSLNVVSIQFGYNFKRGADVKARIGDEQFTLFTHKGYAFAYDPKTDRKLVGSMIKGITMIVEGISSRGTKTKDTFSLSGFTAAYKAINKECKVK